MKPDRLISIKRKSLSQESFYPIKNGGTVTKPCGGLWASPYTPGETYISAWHEWCDLNEFGSGLSNDAVLIDIKPEAKWFVINSQQELKELFNLVGEYNPYPEFASKIFKGLDFEQASQKFDIIYLTDEGQWKTRMPFEDSEYNLYGWDCESVLIMNYDCIAAWEYIKLDIVKE